jgi:ribulose-phosphate 3-epimerase
MTKAAEIIPAILPKDFAEVEEKVALVKGAVKTVQVDVCDGQLTPSATWPYRKHDDSFEKIIKEERGLPGWDTLDFEIDLMANHPEDLVHDWVTAGAARILIHAEAKGDILKAITNLQGVADVGLALNIDTAIEVIGAYDGMISTVQCMGIYRIGYQGQPFDERVIEKIREVKAAHPDLSVSVDGGVSLDNAERLMEAGADRLVVGSALFNADDDIVETIRRFRDLS